jgi:hypothetical protein
MTATFSRGARLKEELSAVIESKELALSGLQKNYLRSRWLEQSARAEVAYRRVLKGYYALRLAMVAGGTALPVLVALSVGEQTPGGLATTTRALTVFSGLLVSLCVAVEHLFDVGGRYRRCGRVAGRLQAEGWRFLQLSGPYASYKNHSDAFQAFANQIEALSQGDTEVYNFDVVHERPAAPEVGGVEAPKKYEGSRPEEAGLTESPLLMPNVSVSRQSYQRAQ